MFGSGTRASSVKIAAGVEAPLIALSAPWPRPIAMVRLRLCFADHDADAANARSAEMRLNLCSPAPADGNVSFLAPRRVAAESESHTMHSHRFLYAPAIEIPAEEGAGRDIVRLADSDGKRAEVVAEENVVSLDPVWNEIAVGFVCASPSSVQLPDGRIVTAFYASRIEGRDGYHMGSVVWDLKETLLKN